MDDAWLALDLPRNPLTPRNRFPPSGRMQPEMKKTAAPNPHAEGDDLEKVSSCPLQLLRNVCPKTQKQYVTPFWNKPRVQGRFHFFVVTEALPANAVFEIPEKVEIAGHKVGNVWCMVQSQMIRLTPESLEKCEALRYRGGAKHLLTEYHAVCFAMFFGASVELRNRHLS
ncbi:hypothetical protein TNCV_2662971 [Trichonephila clavipes]|nr:hypothetical protein TNCV_2662971 [Trichonephila clavipes]